MPLEFFPLPSLAILAELKARRLEHDDTSFDWFNAGTRDDEVVVVLYSNNFLTQAPYIQTLADWREVKELVQKLRARIYGVFALPYPLKLQPQHLDGERNLNVFLDRL